MLPFSLEFASTMAAGPFNPHIITPQWLMKNEVCAAGSGRAKFMPFDPSQGQAFEFGDGMQWQIDYRRLVVISRDENCGQLVAKVIKLLQHTPVRSVAHSFNYSVIPVNQRKSAPSLSIFDPEHKRQITEIVGKVEQLRWTCVLNIDGAVVEVTIADQPELSVALFSFYRDTESDPVKAVMASERFAEDKKESESLLNRLFA